MPHQYVIKVETVDKDGVIATELLTQKGRTFIVESLSDACDAVDAARKWVKGTYIICMLKELPSVTENG